MKFYSDRVVAKTKEKVKGRLLRIKKREDVTSNVSSYYVHRHLKTQKQSKLSARNLKADALMK